jgi:archaellum component FlaC
MHIKFLAHGRGSASKAAAYVLASHDHKGIERAGVEVLRGDPQTFAAIADSLEFKNKYTSGVIAWSLEDNPTPEEINAVLDDFERVAFAGLEPDSYHYCAVLHEEPNGAKHIHILIPNVHLTTGKAFNPAPPNWEKTFDPLRDAWNNEKGWARPDDPTRARLVQPRHTALINAAAAKAGLAVEPDTKDFLTQYLTQRVLGGFIENRADVLESLAELGEITRAGKDYISIKPEGFDKAIRLKGALFHEQFSSQSWIEVSREVEAGRGANRAGREQITAEHRSRASEARAALAAAIERREDYNGRRYKKARISPAIDAGLEAEPNSRPDRGDQGAIPDPVQIDGNENGTRPTGEDQQRTDEPENRDRQGDQQPDRDTRNNDPEPDTDDSKANQNAIALLAGRFAGRGATDSGHELGANPQSDLVAADNHQGLREGRQLPSDAGRGVDELPNGRQLEKTVQEGGLNDSIGNLANSAIERINRAIQSAIESIRKTIRGLAESIEQNQSAIDGNKSAIENHDRELSNLATPANTVIANRERIAQGVKIVRSNNLNEIERFKQEINLVEYAQVMGYELDKKASSKASAVMRRNGEKIIIATDKDGHGIYFNVGDNRDNGSIIDFIQNRNNMNLGEIRKVLRPWIGVSNQPVLRATTPAPKPIATTRDRAAAVAAWEALRPYSGDYLQAERKLSAATVAAFGDRIRQDARGNVCFRHIDLDGVTGYEIKNKGFTGFATGGEKAVFTCRINEDKPVSKVIVTESAIDAMSYHEMNGVQGEGVVYLSFGGGMSDRQKQVLRDYLTVKGLTDTAQVIVATDNDPAGHAFALEIHKIRPDAVRHEPDNAKDWNDMLKLDVLSRSQRVLQQRQAKPPESEDSSPSPF